MTRSSHEEKDEESGTASTLWCACDCVLVVTHVGKQNPPPPPSGPFRDNQKEEPIMTTRTTG